MNIGEVYRAVKSPYRGEATITIADHVSPTTGGGQRCTSAIWRLEKNGQHVLNTGKAYEDDLDGKPIRTLTEAELDELWQAYWKAQ